MAALMVALEDDPADRHRRWCLSGPAWRWSWASRRSGVQTIHHRRQQLERQIDTSLASCRAGERRIAGPRAAATLRELRSGRSPFCSTVAHRAQGRDAVAAGARGRWRKSRARARAEQAYETALRVEFGTAPICARPARGTLIVEDHPLGASDAARRPRALARRAARPLRRRQPARLPSRARSGVRRRQPAGGGAHARAVPGRSRDRKPHARGGVAAGGPAARLHVGAAGVSYRLQASAPGFADMVYPFEVGRGESRGACSSRLLSQRRRARRLPASCIGAGRSSGSVTATNSCARSWTMPAPLHRRATNHASFNRYCATKSPFASGIAFSRGHAGERASSAATMRAGRRAVRGCSCARTTADGSLSSSSRPARPYRAGGRGDRLYAGRQGDGLARTGWIFR